MPHLSVELSRNLVDRTDIPALLAALHAAAAAAGLPGDLIRARAHVLDHYHIGTGAPEEALAAIVLRVAPGRPQDALRAIGEAVRARAAALLAPAGLHTHLTVEVQEVSQFAAFREILVP